MKKIEIKDIPALEYEGYLWYSHKELPEFIDDNKSFHEGMLDRHPFIVEGALYDKEENISVTIRNIDGDYIIHQFDLMELENKNYHKIEHIWFVAKDQTRKALMVEVWKLEEDKPIISEIGKDKEILLCKGMPSYRPAFWIFKGFVK